MDFEADVIVAGAGPAGIAAAVSAARKGVECLVLDSSHSLGGIVANTGIFSLCGVFASNGHGHSLPDEWSFLLERRRLTIGTQGLLAITPWWFSEALESLTARFDNIQVIKGMPVSRGMKFRAGALVDCTGEAELAFLAGVETVVNPPAAPGLGFVLSGVDVSLLAAGAIDITRMAMSEFPDISFRLFPELCLCKADSSLVPGMLNLSEKDASMTAPELYERAVSCLHAAFDFLKASADALDNAELFWNGNMVGRRSGRVIKGRKTLCFESAGQADAVVKGYWPSELWKDAAGAHFSYLSSNHIAIPDECLEADFEIPFFAAGRCMSADAEAQASVRVAGTSICTGARAGYLAACMALERGRKDVML